MYSVVKYAPRMWHAYLAGGATATGLVIEQTRHWNQNWSRSVVLLTGFYTAVWLVGYTLRTRRVYLSSVEERAATAERERDHLAKLAVADERVAIGRELHDVVAHGVRGTALGRLDPLALQWVVIVHEVFNGPLVGRGCVRVPAARA
jgi:signal transduction histidine kinase